MQFRAKHLGLLLGLGFGWLIVQYGFFAAVFVVVMAGIGWFVGRILDGETQITDYIRPREDRDYE